VTVNDIQSFAHVFDGIDPYAGTPPKGFLVDFLGILTDSKFRIDFGSHPETDGGSYVTTRLPTIEDGEGWFEAVNAVEAARAARGKYVMATLGACYAAQAVSACRALQLINPMPYKLVSVEADPSNNEWIVRHYRNNGIDPNDQWMVRCAIGDSNQPMFFPVGSPGTGAQNGYSTNERAARENYLREFVRTGRTEQALRSLLLDNSTGLKKDLVPTMGFSAEIKMVSTVTLVDVLAPFDVVDYLEADMQQSEIVVFPPQIEVMNRKVRRTHIGTHGGDVHKAIADLFATNGWEIVFDYAPNGRFTTPLGDFTTNDGVLTAINPRLP
jgi:hypothetical protein